MPSERDYADMSVEELREIGKQRQLSGIWDMSKSELVAALGGSGSGSGGAGAAAGAESSIRTGPQQSGSLKYAQVVDDPGEHEEKPGKTLVTTNHDVILNWAEARKAVPATVAGTRHGNRLGVLRFNFGGDAGAELEEVSWDEWFRTFDERGLNFIFQEHRADGTESNFFRIENPEREDA